MLKNRPVLSSIIVLLVMTTSSLLLGARSLNRRGNTASTTSTTASNQTSQQEVSDDKGIWLMVQPQGFATKELMLSSGEYLVIFQNATGLENLKFAIERENGELFQQVQFPINRKVWKQNMLLTSGTYLVTEAEHPDWLCRLTVR